MSEKFNILLGDRALLALSGGDTVSFLQGLVTNDVGNLAPDRAIYAALLTPQGKFLHDFFAFQRDAIVYLDCEAQRRDDLARRLNMYRLRADVAIDPVEDGAILALYGAGALAALKLDSPGAARRLDGGIVFADPRLAGMGARAWLNPEGEADLAKSGFETGALADYEAMRIALGVPDGSRDISVENYFALEGGLEEFNGVDFEKGCYVGQEVTARMKHRNLVRKRLMPVRIAGGTPQPGADIRNGETVIGSLRSIAGGRALAMLRLDQLDSDGELIADGAVVTPEISSQTRTG